MKPLGQYTAEDGTPRWIFSVQEQFVTTDTPYPNDNSTFHPLVTDNQFMETVLVY